MELGAKVTSGMEWASSDAAATPSVGFAIASLLEGGGAAQAASEGV